MSLIHLTACVHTPECIVLQAPYSGATGLNLVWYVVGLQSRLSHRGIKLKLKPQVISSKVKHLFHGALRTWSHKNVY